MYKYLDKGCERKLEIKDGKDREKNSLKKLIILGILSLRWPLDIQLEMLSS